MVGEHLGRLRIGLGVPDHPHAGTFQAEVEQTDDGKHRPECQHSRPLPCGLGPQAVSGAGALQLSQ